jgi:hypothetical protein
VVGTYKRAVSDYGGKFPHLNVYFYLFLELYNLYSSPTALATGTSHDPHIISDEDNGNNITQ